MTEQKIITKRQRAKELLYAIKNSNNDDESIDIIVEWYDIQAKDVLSAISDIVTSGIMINKDWRELKKFYDTLIDEKIEVQIIRKE